MIISVYKSIILFIDPKGSDFLYCTNCGSEIANMNSKFCSSCGERLEGSVEQHVLLNNEGGSFQELSATSEADARSISEQVKGAFLHTTEKINGMVGEKGNIDLKLSDVFSAVLKKHTKQEGEMLFISGTELTTPKGK